jgi:hypothetical protein
VKYSAVRHDYRDSYPKSVAVDELDQKWAFHMQLRSSMVDVNPIDAVTLRINQLKFKTTKHSRKHNGGEEFDDACPHDNI